MPCFSNDLSSSIQMSRFIINVCCGCSRRELGTYVLLFGQHVIAEPLLCVRHFADHWGWGNKSKGVILPTDL